MIKWVFISIVSVMLLACNTNRKDNLKLIYSETFDNDYALDNWVMEGPGEYRIHQGCLLLNSKYSDATQTYLDSVKMVHDNGANYYDFVSSLMAQDSLYKVEDFKSNGKFWGGHMVLWNKQATPDNYVLEMDFKSLSKYALHMIMFSHLGINGESVFDDKLKKRNGIASQYTMSDMVGYRVSYYAPRRGTTNLRKSPEKQLLVKGDDYTLTRPNEWHHLKIVKHKATIRWFIDHQEAFTYTEQQPEKVLKGGYFALRLMVPAKGLYDNIKVYQIEDN